MVYRRRHVCLPRVNAPLACSISSLVRLCGVNLLCLYYCCRTMAPFVLLAEQTCILIFLMTEEWNTALVSVAFWPSFPRASIEVRIRNTKLSIVSSVYTETGYWECYERKGKVVNLYIFTEVWILLLTSRWNYSNKNNLIDFTHILQSHSGYCCIVAVFVAD